jgi:hypothetical protein
MAARENPSKGHYLGTVVNGKWWKRHRRDGMFARGNGEWWIEGGGLYFRRYLTREPIVIALDRVASVEIGTWHAGRWAGGRPVIKLTWEQEGRLLTAGFVFVGTLEEARVLSEKFRVRS